jgi:excinuclease ABC subunit A
LEKDLLLVLIEGNAHPVQFSKQLMCEDTGISYEEPSPNAFSFNSPYGACPVCKGLGDVYQVSLTAVIPDDNKSINEGGIAPLGEEREAGIFKQVQQLSKKYKFSLDKPIHSLPAKVKNVLLYGREELDETAEILQVEIDTTNTLTDFYAEEYEGVIPMLKRWFGAANTTEAMRDWVEKYMELTPCADCAGTRLKKKVVGLK